MGLIRPWTAEEDQALRDLRAAGKSYRKIATTLGRTKSAVGYRLGEIGAIVRHIPWPQHDLNRLLELRLSGMAVHRIAAILGRSVPSVFRKISALIKCGTICSKRHPATVQQWAALTSGCSDRGRAVIAGRTNTLGLPVDLMDEYRALRRYGIPAAERRLIVMKAHGIEEMPPPKPKKKRNDWRAWRFGFTSDQMAEYRELMRTTRLPARDRREIVLSGTSGMDASA